MLFGSNGHTQNLTTPGYLNVGPVTATPPAGSAVIQNSLLVGATAFPAGIGVVDGDAVHAGQSFNLGQTWFHRQLILPSIGTSPTWTVKNNPGDGVFLIAPNWNWAGGFTMRPNGDATFPQRMSIGDVACSNGPCPGRLGINNLTLAVGGRIGARQGVHVSNIGAAWPDYVFGPGYALPPLAQVEQYVAAYHHLPDVPSAADVADAGVELVTMDATLLRKVEELTLYLIRLEKDNAALHRRLQALETAPARPAAPATPPTP